ncbi:MAG: ABC transporter substrate-binding protein [Rhodocyclales bacterium]|nr:ABC transporter substrate-binding protein [Rhodocyclales bacterium]
MRRSSFRQGLLAFLVLAWATAAHAACPRIVSQSPYITHQLAWLGLKSCIVGASRYEHAVKVPDTGGVLDPDAAAIAALKPDLVIASNWTAPEKLAAVTPPGARGIRLDSFQSMEQITGNLRELGQLAGVADTAARAAAFDHLWRKKAAAIAGGGRRVLLLSSCAAAPYSFGHDTWLAELFSAAGFVVADTSRGVRRLAPATSAAAAAEFIAEFKPEIVFVFNNRGAESCGTVPLPPETPIVALAGEKFLHPAPVLLDGLDDLQAARSRWAP